MSRFGWHPYAENFVKHLLQSPRERARYWTDGEIIGSKAFVMDLSADVVRQERASKRRYGRGFLSDGTALYSLRQLRNAAPGPG